MNLLLCQSPEKNPREKALNHVPVPIYEPLNNPNESIEFTSDVPRVTDHPPVYTEGCIAAGCPEDLW